MRVLITGGAGFIGSHLGDALLAAGHTVRALDNLDPQVHAGGERPGYLNSEIELHVGDVRDHEAVGRALDGMDTVVHFAAAVGVGQSMYAIERYTSINAMGAAIVLEEIASRRDQLPAGAGRLLDVDLRRGPLPLPRARPAGTAGAQRRAARRAASGSCACERCGAHAGAAADRRGQADLADVDLRRQQARPRGDVPRHRPRAPAARRSRCASSTSTATARRCRTPTPVWPRSSAAGC